MLRNERHGDAIRAIRSDNGSEFRTPVFESVYASQNGVVEIKKQDLV
jgi:hypothetical protein